MLEKDKPTGSVSYTAPNGAKVTAIPSKYIPRMLRVAIYCRVSTLHDDQLNSLGDHPNLCVNLLSGVE